VQTLKDAWTKFVAQWPGGVTSTPNEAVEITKIRAALVAIQRSDPSTLTAAGIPAQTLPPGGGEYLPPPGPGDTVPPPPIAPLTVKSVPGTAVDEPLDTGSKSGGGTGPGPGTPGGDAGAGGGPAPGGDAGAGPGPSPGGDAGGGGGPGTSLDRREGGGGMTESKGVPGWVWGAGAAAVLGVGYLVFRKPGK
jgi:hypothetical protein